MGNEIERQKNELTTNTMTKKIIGIFLLVIGGIFFLLSAWALVINLTTTKEEIIQQTKTAYDEKVTSNYFSQVQIEKVVDDNRKFEMIILPFAMLIGAGIAFGGFALFNRGKKDIQLSDTFKFD